MSDFRFSRAFGQVVVLAVLAVWALGALFATHLGIEAVGREGGPLETTQLILLAVTTALFAWSGARTRSGARMAAVVAGIASLTLFLREFEPQVTGPFTAYLAGRAFRVHQAVLTVAPLLVYAACRQSEVMELLRWAGRGGFWPALPVAALLALGASFDGRFLFDGIPYLPTLFEELAETAAYAIGFLVSAQVAFGQHAPTPVAGADVEPAPTGLC